MVIFTDQTHKYCRKCRTQTKEILGLGQFCSNGGSVNDIMDEYEMTNKDHPVFNSLWESSYQKRKQTC